MLQPRHPILRFGSRTLDLRRGCLFDRNGKEVKLRPKSFEVLKYLLENSGRLIAKQELIASIWPDTAVTDDSLVQCMLEVRLALGDDGHRLVKTVPRRGYILLSDVSVSPPADRSPETTEPLVDPDGAATSRTVTRLAVLPFRLLKPDAEIDFLSYSLPDAITGSLAGLQSLVVRSSVATRRYAMEQSLDLRRVASELDVDLLLSGTLLRDANDLRVSAELTEAHSCKVLWTQVSRISLRDIFDLQDSLARRIVSALPLTPRDRDQISACDVPRDKRAYELFLRANRFAMESNTWRLAHRLYDECLEHDPSFAPAWARLGRIRRVLGKYNTDGERGLLQEGAERALTRALELNPDLSAAHLYLSQLETDLGRAEESMALLLRRARHRGAEPEILAALVHSCRYCGLLDASVAAHNLAMRLDPAIETSVLYSYFALEQYERALESGSRSADTLDGAILSLLGRPVEARAAAVREDERFATHQVKSTFYSAIRAVFENRLDDARALLARRAASHTMDGEAIYHTMRVRAFLGDCDEALQLFERSIAHGYVCPALFDRDPWLASIRAEARFAELMPQVRLRHQKALARFDRENGRAVLGIAHLAVQ